MLTNGNLLNRIGKARKNRQREELLSIMDQHNLPIGAAFDYLYRLVKQIKVSQK